MTEKTMLHGFNPSWLIMDDTTEEAIYAAAKELAERQDTADISHLIVSHSYFDMLWGFTHPTLHKIAEAGPRAWLFVGEIGE